MPEPTALYDYELDKFATQELKNPQSPTDERVVHLTTYSHMVRVAESLLYAQKLAFRVTGENVVAAVLLRAFGYDAFRRLLAADAIEFLMEREFVAYIEDDKVAHQGGLNPLVTGHHKTSVYVDPEESAFSGISKWAPHGLTAKKMRFLARKVAARTKPLSEGIAEEVVRRTQLAYESGDLADAGLSRDAPITMLERGQRDRLCGVANDLLQGVALVREGYDLFEAGDVWQALLCGYKRFHMRDSVRASVGEVLEIERVPAIDAMIALGAINFDDIVRLRVSPETIDFRKWLWSQPDPAATKDVSDAYLAALLPSHDRHRSHWSKAARISTVSVVGGVLGTLAAGPAGGIAGATIGTGVSSAVSLLDGFLVERLLKARNPRRFATDVLAPRLARARRKA